MSGSTLTLADEQVSKGVGFLVLLEVSCQLFARAMAEDAIPGIETVASMTVSPLLMLMPAADRAAIFRSESADGRITHERV